MTIRSKIIAFIFGIFTHLIFLLAIILMAKSLYEGLSSQPWKDLPLSPLLINTFLVLQFPFLHSIFLSTWGRAFLSKLFPGVLGKYLVTTTYALFASLQILITFAFWVPSGEIIWAASGSTHLIMTCLYIFSWILLGKSMLDAGLSIQTGSLGWTSVVRGQSPSYPQDFPREGLFRICRQPIYLSFALILWSGPVVTLDKIVLGLVWGVYCIVGPRLKEARFLAKWGTSFKEYQKEVPYFTPRLSAK